MKTLSVSFASGIEVLGAYWGLLSNGGLAVPWQDGLSEGDEVALEVTIASSGERHCLAGRIAGPGLGRDRAFVAFHADQPHELLLSAAWADAENVPARTARRVAVDRPVTVRQAQAATSPGRLLNVSTGGCCLRLGTTEAQHLEAGQAVGLLADGLELEGVVRWRRGPEVGLEFRAPAAREALAALGAA